MKFLTDEGIERFVDIKFPPILSSVYGNNLNQDVKPLNNSIKWLRPYEIFGEDNYSLFKDKIEPNDINQGALDDCWFMCALSCLAEFPKRIINIFDQTLSSLHDKGLYRMRICKDGVW